MSREIPLTKGYVAIVDDDDFEQLSATKWCVKISGKYRYAYGWVPIPTYNRWRQVVKRGRSELMHRYITGAEPGQQVDHVNHNGLDNRRENLRLCSRAENQANQLPRGGSSCYRGVSWYKPSQKWVAQLQSGGAHVYREYFNDEVDAAKAYDAAAREQFGEFANLNFPEDREPGHIFT